MLATDKLFLLTMLVTVSSPMLYRRYSNRAMDWESLLASQSAAKPSAFPQQPQQPSSAFSKLRQNLGAQRNPSLAQTGMSKSRQKTSCRPRTIQLTIKPPIRLARQCGITTVMTKGCWGYCSSYSQPDPRNTTSILHKCSCCQPTRFVESRATLRCLGGRAIRVPVRQVLGCYCRPCYSEGPSRDMVTVRDLLRKAAAHG